MSFELSVYQRILKLFNSIKVYLYSVFHDANHCKAALQKIQVSTLYKVIAYPWWLSQVDVHMAEI